MRSSFRAAVILAAAAIAIAPAAADQPSQNPRRAIVETLLARARAALGGDARLSAVERFVIRGSTESAILNSHARGYAHYEITCDLPGTFAMTTSSLGVRIGNPMFASDGITPINPVAASRTLAIEKGEVVFDLPTRVAQAPFSRPEVRPVDPNQAMLDNLRRETREAFLATTLGMLAASFAAVPVRFDPVPYDANALWVTGAGEPKVLAFDPVTHLPARFGDFSWSDYRDVDGVKVPHRTTRLVRGYQTTWIVKSVSLDEARPGPAVRR